MGLSVAVTMTVVVPMGTLTTTVRMLVEKHKANQVHQQAQDRNKKQIASLNVLGLIQSFN